MTSPIAAPGNGGDLAYERVAADIEQQIRDGRLKSGQRLIGERAMAEHYGVAYQTVRRAMQVLRDRGLIRTVHGRGTFVA